MTATETPLIGGRYQILETLGRGGMATVHRARDTQLQRDVALKVMRPDLAEDPIFEARFVNEARNAASISHPNVVTVLDFGTDGPGPYLVMELVDGGDLARVLAADGPLPPQRAAAIAAEVATALQAAHARGIVHRDVKPGNILLAADGHPRVADFGIARATGEQSLTGTGTSLGSVDYFSPEQARGEAATAASDIYALGVVLYEMLTGSRPFVGETAYAVAVARIDAAPPDPRAARRSIPKPVAAVVQRAMATDPVGRYPSAGDMAAALQTWLSRRTAKAAPAARATAAVLAADADPATITAADSRPARPSTPRARRSRSTGAAAGAAAAGAAAAGARAAAPAGVAATSSAAETDETRPIPVARVAPVVPVAPVAAPSQPAVATLDPVPGPAPAEDRADRRRRGALLAVAAVALIAVIGFAGARLLIEAGEDPMAGVVVGEPRGGVLPATPEPTEEPTPTPEPTPDPTASPTPTATPVPVAAATPAPVAPPPPRATPPPQTVVVAMAEAPTDTVERWYALLVDGQFDAAYSMWSDRMKANFPRQGNLDNRWRDTAAIEILQLYVVEQTTTTAAVQIEFIEYRDNGSSRRFLGWWELVRSGDGWLLDAPHF